MVEDLGALYVDEQCTDEDLAWDNICPRANARGAFSYSCA